jgi:hypothetical protein
MWLAPSLTNRRMPGVNSFGWLIPDSCNSRPSRRWLSSMPGAMNRSVFFSLRFGECTADLYVTADRMNFLPGDSRQTIQQLVLEM